MIRLQWTEQTGSGGATYIASYQLVDEGESSSLYRVACAGAGAPTVIAVARQLPPPSSTPVVVTLRDNGINIIGLSMSLTTVDGDTLRVDAQSNNPNQTLDPLDPTPTIPAVSDPCQWDTTLAATDPLCVEPTTTTAPETTTTIVGETTTTTTTTTLPATTTTTIPCVADFVFGTGPDAPVRPSSVRNQQSSATTQNIVFGPLQSDVTISITKSGSCAGLRLEFVRAPGSPNAAEREEIRETFGDGVTVILRKDIATERWEDGTREFRLFDVGNDVHLGRVVTLEVT